jgi:hypothetical protein
MLSIAGIFTIRQSAPATRAHHSVGVVHNRSSGSVARPAVVEPLEGRRLLAASLGGGLQFQSEKVYDHALADLVKSSSGFKNLTGGNATTDSNGYPTQDFTVPLWSGSKLQSGRYTISFSGPSSTWVSFSKGTGTLKKQSSSGSTQNWTLDVPSTSATELTLKFTGTSGQVKNLHVMQPGTSVGTTWSPKYVDHLRKLHPTTLRMMDIVKANYNATKYWSERPKDTDATYARAGVRWESLIDLCNTLGSNLWVTIPVGATDDYVKQFASLIKTRLSSNLKVYVELANEVWSSATYAGKTNTAAAKAEVAANSKSNLKYDGTTDPVKWAERRYARRMMEISNLFKSVWTTTFNGTSAQSNPINSRVRVILGGQAGVLSRFDDMLGYINKFYGAPKNYFYGTGLAWYFTLNKYADKYNPPTNLTKTQVLEGMDLSVKNYESGWFRKPAQQAAAWGMKLEAYELGVDTMGSKNISAKAAASMDPKMSSLMQRFVNAFVSQGGDSAQWFQLGANTYNSTSGTWAITNDLNNLNSPKEQGFRLLRGYAALV